MAKILQKPTKLNERGWVLLLTEISKGNVIPIVGDELFKVNVRGEIVPLKKYIAQQLSERLNIDYEEGIDTTQISSKFYEPYWDAIDSDPYYETTQILKNLDQKKLIVSETLKHLLSIDKFKLVLTTSCGSLVFNAMEEIWGKNKVKNLHYEKHSSKEDIEDEHIPTCYQMFGIANVCPNSFVLSEDNLLEFISDWLSENYRPKRLSNLLREKYLLVIGCDYPDWLFRFFLHSMKVAVSSNSSKTGLITSNKFDCQLVEFLSRMRASIHENAESFVEELVVRYKNFKTESIQRDVFISYASEDYEVAKGIAETFTRLGIGVWFDKDSLDPGDEYVKEIRKNIEECKVFVPVLSKSVINSGRRFYKREWAWAKEEIGWRGSEKFIYPIRIDNVDPMNEIITDFFPNQHIVDFNAEHCEDNIKKIIREVRAHSL